MKNNQFFRIILVAILLCSMGLSLSIDGSQRRRRYRNPEAGKRKAAKRIGIGAAIGAGAGGLIGGRKGALIGAGVGAGSGTVYHYHKKRKYRRRYRAR